MKNHLDQMKELNGKILYSFNGCINELDDVMKYNRIVSIVYNENKKNVKLVIHQREVGNGWTEFGDDDYIFSKDKNDNITAYVTDDGYVNFMLRDGYINSKKFIYKKKLFNPSGVLPYKFVTVLDGSLLVYDSNFKIIGSIKNETDFKDVDFVWPDKKYFYDKTGKYSFNVDGGFYFWENLHSISEREHKFTSFSSMKGYKSIDVGDLNYYYSPGYLIIDKNGILKHIIYTHEGYKENAKWEPNEKVKGDGPYSMDVFNFGLVLLNGKGEVYLTTYDDVEKTNEAYQAYLKNLNN